MRRRLVAFARRWYPWPAALLLVLLTFGSLYNTVRLGDALDDGRKAHETQCVLHPILADALTRASQRAPGVVAPADARLYAMSGPRDCPE